MSFIYALRCDPGYIKIGFTTQMAKRMSMLKTVAHVIKMPDDAVPSTLKCLGYIKGSFAKEVAIHAKLKPLVVAGTNEWYREADAVTVLNAAGLGKFLQSEIDRDPLGLIRGPGRPVIPTKCRKCGELQPNATVALYHCRVRSRKNMPTECLKCGSPTVSARGARDHCSKKRSTD